MANPRKLGILAAIALFFVTLGGAVFVVAWYLWPEGSGQTDSTALQAAQATAANSAGNQIQVGIYLSTFTATGPHRSDLPYGYQTQLRPVKMLLDPSIHLIPVIEPGTRGSAEMTKVLWQNFPAVPALDASNPDDLRKLDILVTTAAADVPDEVLHAIDQSVKGGMGLLQRQMGYLQPGYNPLTNELCGFTTGTFGWNPRPVDCEVMATHPLLGDLSGQIGKTISMMPNGTVGTLVGTPLIRVKDMANIRLVAADHPIATGEYLYPLYISQLGKGKIVGIGFAQNAPIPEILQTAHHGRFYIHCVEWLAGRPLN